jgi:hypothetical protein
MILEKIYISKSSLPRQQLQRHITKMGGGLKKMLTFKIGGPKS